MIIKESNIIQKYHITIYLLIKKEIILIDSIIPKSIPLLSRTLLLYSH